MVKPLREAVVFYNEKLLEYDPLTEKQEGGRLSSIIDQMKTDGVWEGRTVDADIAPMKRLRDIHDNDYLNDLHKRSYSGLEQLDENTPLIKQAFEIARFGAGGVLDAVDRIMEEQIQSALCLTAMPGHHAGISSFGYGSLVNPAAAGAQYLTKKYGLKRVAVLDIDAEHGSGTQEIFYTRRDVMTMSVHEYPGVTGTGHYEDLGGKGALGHNINIPVASGYGDREYRVCIKEIIEKILLQYNPQFLILCFGTNVLAQDPASHLIVSEQGLSATAVLINEIAQKLCGGKLISILEGGTPGRTMAKSVSEHFSLMLNDFILPVDRVKKDELISYADWYSYAKILKAQFKKIWRL